MASTLENHVGPIFGSAVKGRTFPEIAEVVQSGCSDYSDILELFNVGTSIPDEEENFEVTKLLCDVLDSKIPVPTNFNEKLKLDACDWLGICMPSLFSTKKWKRALALKLIGSLQKVLSNIELSMHVRWDALRNTLLRHIDSLMDLVCERDKHWFDVWIVAIDILGKKLALNTNRPLLNKLFKVLSPFKEDFQKFPHLQEAVREVPFKLLTVECWQKVVDYWLQGAADVPLNHVMTIIRFFKRLDTEPIVVRAKCLCMWRVVCLLPPGHKGLQPSIDQLFAMMLNQTASKGASKGVAAPGSSSVELVPDLLSEMLALMLGANLCPDHELVVSADLILPTHDLIGTSSMFLQKIFQCFEKFLLINPVKNAVKPNAFAIKVGFSCFLSKLNTNPSYELINSVLKLPQNIFLQANDNIAILNNCIDVVVKGIVCGSNCFGDSIMSSSKYYSGSNDLMTGSPTLMLTRYLLDKTKLELLDIEIVLSILETLIPKGTKTVHYVLRVMSVLKSLCANESISFVTVLKVWQIVVVSVNTQYGCEADFTRETPDLGWIYSVILFPLHNFNEQYWVEILSYTGSKHLSELLSKLLTNEKSAAKAITTSEALALKLDRLLSTANNLRLPAIAAVSRVLITSTPFSRFPRGERYLKSTFSLVTNLVNFKCLTEGVALELVKIIEALSVCLDGNLPTLIKLTSLVVSLLRLPSLNKCVTDSALITSLLFIETAEKEYGKNALPSVTMLKAAYQYCQAVAKADETRNVTPKRRLASGELSPALVRRITPKRVGLSPSTATAEAAQAEQKSTKSKHATPATSPSIITEHIEPVNESSMKLEPPKKLAAFGRPRGPLTKHQREKMRERQDNIPALYVDLTQESQAVADSQPEFTQDSSSLVVPQRFSVTTATLELDSNVESRPFASVVQEPQVITIDSAKEVQNKKKKPLYDIFGKNKKEVLQPIHLKRVHAPVEVEPLIETIKQDESLVGSQNRPFKAFSPANKNKCELSQPPAAESAIAHRVIARKCLLPEADFSQDFVADSQRTETPASLVNDDGIAMFPTELNSPVKIPGQKNKNTPEINSDDITLENTSKRKILNNFEDSELTQPLCKKQSLTSTGNSIAGKSAAHPASVDESSNNSTDSNTSAIKKRKRNELAKLQSNLVLNETPLPVKRARKLSIIPTLNAEDNSNAKAKTPGKSKNSRKSQVLNISDCDSTTSEASSVSDVPLKKKRTLLSRLVPNGDTKDILEKMKSNFEESQDSLKPVTKLKTRSSVGRKSVIEPVHPVSADQNKKEAKIKSNKGSGSTKKLVPASVESVILEKDSQNHLAKEPILQPLPITAPTNTLKVKDNSTVAENSFVPVVEVVPRVEILVPDIDLTEDSPSSVNENHKNSSNNALAHPKELPSTALIADKDQRKYSIPVVSLDSEVEGSDSETCKDLLLKKDARLRSDIRPESVCLNLVSDKENKIIEESQDSIIPCSQSDHDAVKMLVTKRKRFRPKILSRSSNKSASKKNVLSSVFVVPETQILDGESAEKTSSVTSNSVPELVTVVEPCNETDRLGQQDENGELEPAVNQSALASEAEKTNPSSNTDVQIASEQVVETAADEKADDDEVTNSLKDATTTVNEPEQEPGKDMQSPPRPGPKVMENLSPSMLRLLSGTHVQKASKSEPTCRSKKMLQMVLPYGPETNMRMKQQAEKQEASIYVDQTFPAQECLVGEDGTPVLRDWKKCVPSPSSVPARSSMKGSLKKDGPANNRKLCFPFEPTTKVLFYYEKKNSKCNENISQIKMKKQLRKKKKTLREEKALADLAKEVDQPMLNADVNESNSGPVQLVLLGDEPSLTKTNLSITDELPSSLEDSHVPVAELISLPKFQIAAEELENQKQDKCEPIIANNTEHTTYPEDTPMVWPSPYVLSHEKSTSILSDPLVTEIEPISIPTQASKPAAIANTLAETPSLFEDSYYEFVTPTPLSLPDPELLNGTDPLYKDLIDCQQPIAFMVPSLTTPQWQDDFSKVLAERNIVTVGDFCRRTERQIDLLPIKKNKVKTAMQALDKHKLQLQIADACPKDLLKGLENNKHSKQVFDRLYPITKNLTSTSETQTCSGVEDLMHDNFVRNASNDRLLSSLHESGKFADDNFIEKLVNNIEPSKYVSMRCSSGSVDDLSLELANSINLLPGEERMRHIHTLLSHLKFKD